MGGRSRAAAQLLAGKGFKEVYNLKGGIKAWQGHTAAGPAEMGMILLSGDETASDIIILAYGMEHGLEVDCDCTLRIAAISFSGPAA